MLEPQLLGIGTRHLERLVIALSGALTIWLGYRLVLSVPLAARGTGKLQLPGGISIFISRVGPASSSRCSAPACSPTGCTSRSRSR